MNILLYIINWLLSFLDKRKQRVVVDGYRGKYVSINRGVPCQRSAVSDDDGCVFLKLGSLRYLLPFCVFKYFSFFRVRVPVVQKGT